MKNSKIISLQSAKEKYGAENCTVLFVDPSQLIFRDIYFNQSNIEGWLIVQTKRNPSWFYIYNVNQEHVIYLNQRLKGQELQYQKKCYQEEYAYQEVELVETQKKQKILEMLTKKLGFTPLLDNGLILSAYDLEYFTCPKKAILSEERVAVEKMHDFDKSHFEKYKNPIEYYLVEHAKFFILDSENCDETYYIKASNWKVGQNQ